MKPLIIGQAPARGNDNKPPFSGLSGRRLAQLLDLGDNGDVLQEYFELVNLIPNWPGKTGKGDSFDMRLAKRHATQLTHELRCQPTRKILFMGKKVRRAMGVNGSWEYLEWMPFLKHQAACFPHPSGVNRWWNDTLQREAAQEFLREVARG